MTDRPDDRISAALRTINFEVAAIKAAATERVERAEAELARLREVREDDSEALSMFIDADLERMRLAAELKEAQAELKTVLDRESATTARYDAKLDAAEAELAKLSDPNAVHVNMLRGTIAKPSWEQIQHLYPKETARLREPVAIGKHIRFSPAEDGIGNAVVCPDEPADGCYWTLIGSGPNADQNRIAQAICDALNARLRAPAGDVGEVVKQLGYFAPPIIKTAVELLLRQAGEIERVNGLLVMVRATIDAHKAAFQANAALLREAGELLHDARENGLIYWDPQTSRGYERKAEMLATIDAFLAKLEPAPTPETVREDTYPDRVSMEPWPYSGHAPGGSDADQ